jgi:hypothetical protein
LTVKEGLETSSIKYNKYKDGKAIISKINIGITVHTVSRK